PQSSPQQTHALPDDAESHEPTVVRIAPQAQDGSASRQRDFSIRQRERAQRDHGVMEYSDHGSQSVDPFEPEPQIHQHAEQRIQNRQLGLPLQLRSYLRSDDLDVAHAEVRQEEPLLQYGYDVGRRRSFQVVQAAQP